VRKAYNSLTIGTLLVLATGTAGCRRSQDPPTIVPPATAATPPLTDPPALPDWNSPASPKGAAASGAAKDLEMIHVDRIRPVRSHAGATIELVRLLPIAESPDYDPAQYLDRFSFRVTQLAGPPASFSGKTIQELMILMPSVGSERELEFMVELSSGDLQKSGKLKVLVAPR